VLNITLKPNFPRDRALEVRGFEYEIVMEETEKNEPEVMSVRYLSVEIMIEYLLM